jgi:Restriction endonuclease
MQVQQEIREQIIERDRGKCGNCSTSVGQSGDVHHIVPRGKGGSDKLSNLRLLCRQCHDAIHDDDVMAPTVEFQSTGQMSTDSFNMFLQFFEELPTARFDPDAKAWRVPKADFDEIVEELNQSQLVDVPTDGGGQ